MDGWTGVRGLGWWMALGCLGLGCDRLRAGAGEEPAEVAAKVDVEGDAAGERAASEAKRAEDGAPAKVVEPGSDAPPAKAGPGAAAAPGAAVEPGTPSQPGATVTPGAVVEPGSAVPPSAPTPEPATAEPAAPSPALPTLAAVTPSDAAFSEKMQRRLRSKLREQHDARTQLASSLALPQPDGGVVVLALYEYSQFEACVGASDGSPEARKECANPTDASDRVSAALRKCTGRGLVRARFGPPPKSQPAYGGELTVEVTRPLEGGCTVTKVRDFTLADVDGDGQPELALDLVTRTPETTFRSASPYDEFTRTVGWYRADLTPQYESALCTWLTEFIEVGSEASAQRIRLEDHDGDGRADLVIESVDYAADEDCEIDETGWLKTAGPVPSRDPDDVEPCTGEVVTTAWRYDPGKDQWIEPAPSSR